MAKKMSYKSSKSSKYPYLLYPGIVLLILGLSLLFLWPTVYKYIINSRLRLSPGSNVYNIWKKTQNPPLLQIYFHNWTNPEDGHNATVKPRFEEVGPFSFEEVKQKLDVTWNENNTVSYRQKKTWKFARASSCCSLSTNLTTLNAILVTMSHKSRNSNMLFNLALTVALKALTPDLYVTKNASQMLFDGYVDQVLYTMKTLMAAPSDRFGWFFGKNDSSKPDGLINMDISAENHGEMRRWNTWLQTPYFEGKCGQVHGSASELYPPRLDKVQTSFFSADMCRNVPLDYEQDVSVHGLTGYKYIAYNRMLDNGTLYPENECFCNGKCVPSGVVNVSSCRLGSPTFLSMPHFLHADPVYVNNVEGLRPEKDKHQLYMVLEPNTGLPIEVAARIQMNMYLKPVDFITIINDVPSVMFPILWFQVQTKASKGFIEQLQFLFKLPTILKGLALSSIIIGLIMIAYALYAKKKTKPEAITRESVPLQSKDEY